MWIKVFIVSIISLFFQIGLFPGLVPEISMPEFFVPLIIVFALVFGKKESLILAFISGLVLDLYFRRAFGLRVLLFLVIAFLLSSYRDKFTRRSIFVVSVITFVVGFIYIVFYGLGLSFLGIELKNSAMIYNIFSLQIPIQVILSIIYYFIFIKSKNRKVEY